MMLQICLSTSQVEDLRLALSTHYLYFRDVEDFMTRWIDSLRLTSFLYDRPLYKRRSLEVADSERKAVNGKILERWEIIAQLRGGAGSYEFTSEQVELIHESVDYYLESVLDPIISELKSNPRGEALFLVWPVDREIIKKDFPKFVENRTNVNFFVNLVKRARETQLLFEAPLAKNFSFICPN